MRPTATSEPAPYWRDKVWRDRNAAGENRAHNFDIRHLDVRLARDPLDIAAFQALRYSIFYEEMSAVADPRTAALRRESDAYDNICDHLLVIDHGRGRGKVVGGYRLLRGSVARAHGGFYTASEFDIAALAGRGRRLLELGRSCVHAAYRDGVVIARLFRGLAAYVAHHEIDLIFGCASLPGIDPSALDLPLSYLVHHHLAPVELRPVALADRYVEMRRMTPEAAQAIAPRAAYGALPPLVKGYLRAGGKVGDGAVIDCQFGTVDVCMVIETARLSDKFRRRYL